MTQTNLFRAVLLLYAGALVACEGGRLAQAPVGSPSAADPTAVPRAASSSLPSGEPRPGPDLLYWPPAIAPQLQNAGIWQAQPILSSGASAYRQGEFLYQDFLYDDWGANSDGIDSRPVAQAVPSGILNDAVEGVAAGVVTGGNEGNYSYPADPVFVGNAADLVELRYRLLEQELAVRITYNSLLDAERTATTLGLGDSAVAQAMPHGANARSPAEVFVTVHGDQVELVDAATGESINAAGARAEVHLERRQIEVRVPFSVFDPRGQADVRVMAASGLWDPAAGQYLIPRDAADEQSPGGAGGLANPPAFFNVAFRYAESGPWNEREQANALATGDLSGLHARIDFRKLAAGSNDDLPDQAGGVPRSGYISRIYASHFTQQQGRGPDFPTCEQPCERIPEFAGQLQPYTLYVPNKPPPPGGYGLTFSLHGCGNNYKAGGPGLVSAFGERAEGSLVVHPNGRSVCMWYWSEGQAELFEIWADLATRFPLDPSWVAITGGSMGGHGTYRMISLWPDLIARAAPYIGCTSAETGWPGPGYGVEPAGGEASVIHPLTPSWRHVPILAQDGNVDPICVFTAQDSLRDTVDALGYRYEWRDWFGEHVGGAVVPGLLEPTNAADFLGDARVLTNPPRVTYVYSLKANELSFGLNADKAYWVSGLALREVSGAAPMGQIDVFSHGFGVGDAPVLPTQPVAGPGYYGQSRAWGEVPQQPVANRLEITARNIAAITIHVERAQLGCDADLDIDTDGPVTVTLLGADCRRVEEG